MDKHKISSSFVVICYVTSTTKCVLLLLSLFSDIKMYKYKSLFLSVHIHSNIMHKDIKDINSVMIIVSCFGREQSISSFVKVPILEE